MESDDNKTDNRLSEPEVAYERTPKASATEEIGDKYPWLRAYPDYLQEWERLEHPQPCTVEERRARIAAIQARIDAGDDKGISMEELFDHLERVKQLAHGYEHHCMGEG